DRPSGAAGVRPGDAFLSRLFFAGRATRAGLRRTPGREHLAFTASQRVEFRRGTPPAAGFGSLRRPGFNARNDGYHFEHRTVRRHITRRFAPDRKSTPGLGLLPPPGAIIRRSSIRLPGGAFRKRAGGTSAQAKCRTAAGTGFPIAHRTHTGIFEAVPFP